jgi:ribosomal-protein-alanine N-acetyltransferase
MNQIHQWDLNPEPLQAFRLGIKTVEMRLYDEKRQKLRLGDFIRFKNTINPKDTLLVQVQGLQRFPNFKDLYAVYRPEEIGYRPDEHPDYHDMSRYYSEEQIKTYGAYAIKVAVVPEQSGSPILFTDRLVLRPYVMSDSLMMYRNWCHDPEVACWLSWPPHQSSEVTAQFIAHRILQYPLAHIWGITYEGELIGSIDEVRVVDGKPEIGYCLSKRFWGRGFMSEAFHAVLLYFFKDLKVEGMVMSALSDNVRSRRVIEKQGFHFVKMNPHYEFPLKKEVHEVAEYALTRAEFLAIEKSASTANK